VVIITSLTILSPPNSIVSQFFILAGALGEGDDVAPDEIERNRILDSLRGKGRIYLQEFAGAPDPGAGALPAWHLERKKHTDDTLEKSDKQPTERRRRAEWERAVNKDLGDVNPVFDKRRASMQLRRGSMQRNRPGSAGSIATDRKRSEVNIAAVEERRASVLSTAASKTTYATVAEGQVVSDGDPASFKSPAKPRIMKPPPGFWSGPQVVYDALHYTFVVSPVGFYFDLTQSVLSIYACIIYVYSTYAFEHGEEPAWMIYNEWIISVMFIFDYLLQFYLAPNKWQYVTSQMAIIDLICLAPAISLFYEDGDFGFLRLLRGVRVIRVLKAQRLFTADPQDRNEVLQQQISLTCFKLAAIIFVATGAIHTVNELWTGAFSDYNDALGEKMEFFDFLYFIMISVSTMGYGDILPIHFVARTCVMILIVAMIIMVPKETNTLSALMDKTSTYDKPYEAHPLYGHVVLCGKPAYSCLSKFLMEFYHEDHGDQNMRLVILHSDEPPDDIKELIEDMPYGEFVSYVKGEVSNVKDLFRALVFEAEGIFIMSNQLSSNLTVADLDCILTAKALAKMCTDYGFGREVRIYIQLLKEESLLHASSWAMCNQCVCIEQLKMGLLSVAARCPGFSTMLCNLIVSTGEFEAIEAQWLKEYMIGYGQEVYIIDMPPGFIGWRFEEMSALAYTKFGVCVFAITIKDDAERGQEKRTLINPTNYTMMGIEQCCLIADDASEAREFSQYTPSKKAKQKTQADTLIEPGEIVLRDRFKTDESRMIGSCKHLNGHIIVCGKLRGLDCFVEPLRKSTNQPVVYLHPELPDHEDLLCMDTMDNVFFCQGSPLLVADLEEAGAASAAVVTIFSDFTGYFSGREGQPANQSGSREVDRFATTVGCIVDCYFPSCKWVVELVDDSYMRFLPEPAHLLDPPNLWPQYCSGSIFFSNVFDSLIAQAFYNPELIGILSALVGNDMPKDGEEEPAVVPPEELEEWFGLQYPHGWDGSESNTFQQIDVPKGHHGKMFKDCYSDLLIHHQSLAIGMYRGVHHEEGDNALPYVLTNPHQNTVLRSTDKLYVLCPKQFVHV